METLSSEKEIGNTKFQHVRPKLFQQACERSAAKKLEDMKKAGLFDQASNFEALLGKAAPHHGPVSFVEWRAQQKARASVFERLREYALGAPKAVQ